MLPAEGPRLAAPVVARWGTGNPAAPLVVALHDHGASENSMIELAPWLPHGPVAYAAVRGPIAHGSGFAWCEDVGAGRPSPDSLAASMAWFLGWLDAEGDPDRPVILLHLVLPDALAYDALAKGWAVAHPLAGIRLTPGMVLVFGPRDADELDIVAGIVAASHRYAGG